LPELFKTAFDRLSQDRRLKGLVLDLRFARGADYAAAAGVADLFIGADKPQLDVDGRTYRSTAKDDALTLPVTVLVNHATTGAAEALAALFHQNHIGLIIGTNTAGEAYLFRDHPLNDGQKLRIATGTVKLADGQPMLTTGVRPDIIVEVSLAEERQYLDNAYGDLRKLAVTPPLGGQTNLFASAAALSPRKKLNEAELVRRQREGQNLDDDGPADLPATGIERPLLRDPVLVRALDLLKGLAVVKQFRVR
jgi:C-terminal processing protease CtpA/Prc